MSKKIVVPKTQFPAPSIYDPNYNVRFRIISEDRNRVSAWSPIFFIDPEIVYNTGTLQIPGEIKLLKQTGYISASWDAVTMYSYVDNNANAVAEVPYYDVWIQWTDTGGASPSGWIYKGSIFSTSLNIVIPATYPYNSSNIVPKEFAIEIYRPGFPILRYQSQKEFSQTSTTVDITNDTIRINEGHNFTTGSAVVYTSTSPITGLTNTATYYVRTINYKTFALYNTFANSRNLSSTTGRMNLSGTPTGFGNLTGKQFLVYSASLSPI